MVAFLASVSALIFRLGAEAIRFSGNALVILSSGASLVLREKTSQKVVALAVVFACLSGFLTVVTFYERNLGFEQLDIRLCWIFRMCSPLKNEPTPLNPVAGENMPSALPRQPGPPSNNEISVGESQGNTVAPRPTGTDDPPIEASTIVKPSRFVLDPDKAALRELFRQLAASDRALNQKYPNLVAEIARIQRQPTVGPGVARCTLLLSAKSASVTLMTEEIVQGEAVSPDRDQAVIADQACADAIEKALARIRERSRG